MGNQGNRGNQGQPSDRDRAGNLGQSSNTGMQTPAGTPGGRAEGDRQGGTRRNITTDDEDSPLGIRNINR